MAARGKRFSWTRLINNAVPNFANDSSKDVDLSPAQADQLVAHQLSLPFPLYLDPLSFFMAQITTSKTVSAQVYRALIKNGVIAAPPAANVTESKRKMSVVSTASTSTWPTSNENDDATTLSRWISRDPTVRTSGITRNFANQLSTISVHAQRKLVALLFFWEEECTRWKLLEQEEEEIIKAMHGLEEEAQGEDEGEGDVATGAMLGDAAATSAATSARQQMVAERKRFLDMARKAVEMRRLMLPSQRAEATANVADGVGHELPAYQ